MLLPTLTNFQVISVKKSIYELIFWKESWFFKCFSSNLIINEIKIMAALTALRYICDESLAKLQRQYWKHYQSYEAFFDF